MSVPRQNFHLTWRRLLHPAANTSPCWAPLSKPACLGLNPSKPPTISPRLIMLTCEPICPAFGLPARRAYAHLSRLSAP